MAIPADIPAAGGPDDSTQVDLLLDLAKTQVAEAFDVAQALEAKARSLLQISTIFFAASQVTVGIQVAIRTGSSRPTWVALAATAIGLVGLIGLAATAFRAVKLQEPQTQLAVDVGLLRDRLIDFAERGDRRVSRFLLGELASIAEQRRAKNEEKVRALGKVESWAYLALGASAIALLFGLVTAYAYR